MKNASVDPNVTNMKSYELRSKSKTENLDSNQEMVAGGLHQKNVTTNSAGQCGKTINSDVTATAVQKQRKPRRSKSTKSDGAKKESKEIDDTQLRVHNLRSRNVNMSSEVPPTGVNNNEKDTDDDDDYFQCHVCNETFDNYADFKTHRRRNTNAANVTKDSRKKIFTNNTTTIITRVSPNNLCARYATRILSSRKSGRNIISVCTALAIIDSYVTHVVKASMY